MRVSRRRVGLQVWHHSYIIETIDLNLIHFSGEPLELHVTVDNESTVEVTPRATLHQTQVYMCGERHKAKEVAVTESIVGKTVHRNSNLTETLLIPLPEYLSLSIKSGIIRIVYFIHVFLDIPNAIDLHVNVPIVIVNKFVLTLDEVDTCLQNSV